MRRRLIVPALFAIPLLALAARQSGNLSLLAGAQLKPGSEEVSTTLTGGHVQVSIAPGKSDYPGVSVVPPNGAWDLSKYGHVEAKFTNTGTKPIALSLRVDNAGNWQDNPWNTETLTLAPGVSGTVKTIFGYQYGLKPGYKLDPAKVVNVLVFTTKADVAQSFTLDSLSAAGPAHETPPVAPDDARTKPKNGLIFDSKSSPAGSADLAYENGVEFVSKGPRPTSLLLRFPPEAADGIARIKPPQGRWDLRDATQVTLTIRNAGKVPVSPRARIETNGGTSAWFASDKPIPPGQEAAVTVPFSTMVDASQPSGLAQIANDSVSAVAVSVVRGSLSPEQTIEIRRIEATAPTAVLPDWLGKRPPVPGDWTKTLSEEFDGNRLDPTVWKVTGENYYDKITHWTKDNVIVKEGQARIRYSKQTGFQNDDPKRNSTPYAAGYLDTYGLWAQRYGYFEARMKLPSAPGLWPAFWMMPDRGSKNGPEQWKRQYTGDGGMEFDIMEHLTRWGGHRYNIAMHYDGYQKGHQALGSDKVYVETDKDGYITCGLLWLPGEAVYYCNGKEVLRWKNPRISNIPSILMFTLPSGGWDNDAVDDARLPSDLVIDYVRVWQRKDLASPDDGKRNDPQTS